MFQLDKIGMRVRYGDLLHANIPVNGVDYFGVIVEREYLGGLVEAVDEADFLLVGHWGWKGEILCKTKKRLKALDDCYRV